jgi:hypothetical protein
MEVAGAADNDGGAGYFLNRCRALPNSFVDEFDSSAAGAIFSVDSVFSAVDIARKFDDITEVCGYEKAAGSSS